MCHTCWEGGELGECEPGSMRRFLFFYFRVESSAPFRTWNSTEPEDFASVSFRRGFYVKREPRFGWGADAGFQNTSERERV